MFLDAPKPVLFILLGHLNEVSQALFELSRSFASTFDETDPNPFVGVGKFPEVFPGFLVPFDFFQNILWDYEFLVENIAQGFAYCLITLRCLTRFLNRSLLAGE